MQPLSGNERTEPGSGARQVTYLHPDAFDRAPGFSFARFWRKPVRVLKRRNPFSPATTRKIVIAASLTVFAAGAHFTGGLSGSVNAFGVIASKAGFKPEKLLLSGNITLDGFAVENALADQMQQSLFNFNTVEARERLLANPWLASVNVSKVYPDTVVVNVVEREPFAFWKSGEKVWLIARDGTVLGEASPNHLSMPQVVGAGANIAAPEFIATISKFPVISARAKAFVRVAERRWNLVLRDGLNVLLPEDGWKAALADLSRMQTAKKILDRELVQIDMRLADRLVVRLDSQAADERRERLEDLLKRSWHRT